MRSQPRRPARGHPPEGFAFEQDAGSDGGIRQVNLEAGAQHFFAIAKRREAVDQVVASSSAIKWLAVGFFTSRFLQRSGMSSKLPSCMQR